MSMLFELCAVLDEPAAEGRPQPFDTVPARWQVAVPLQVSAGGPHGRRAAHADG